MPTEADSPHHSQAAPLAVAPEPPATRARLVAFYLPQYHPIPENDLWWGKGFTEWTNVTKATPLFPGHAQPRLPGELGFVDLRLPEFRAAQADLALEHGIEAFCYWHYWFAGKRLLERPFNEVLQSGEPQISFCLAWANESWVRTWLGSGEVLQPQSYSAEDDVRHARWLVEAFADPRALRVDGRPVFLVYRPADLPDPARTTDTIRNECVRSGLSEPLLLGINAWCTRTDCRQLGFDGTVDFEPQLGDLPGFGVGASLVSRVVRNTRLGVRSASVEVHDYEVARRLMAERRSQLAFPYYQSIFVGWDNTPRRGRAATVIVNATPERFAAGLDEIISAVEVKPWQERLVFVNAWNEWAEGNHLEPDRRDGRRRLEAVRRAVAHERHRAPPP